MLKMERLMDRLSPKARRRVAAWMAVRWGEITESNADRAFPRDDLEPRPRAVHQDTSSPTPPVLRAALDPRRTRDDEDGGVFSTSVLSGAGLSIGDGIFDGGDCDTATADLSASELTAHVYGLIRAEEKGEVMSLLADPKKRAFIVRGSGVWFPDGELELDVMYRQLERLATTSNDLISQGVSAVSFAVRELLRERRNFGEAAKYLVKQYPEAMHHLVREYTHECMLPMINTDPDLTARYNSGGKARVVDFWEALRKELDLAYFVPNQ